jgi:hypothetical protein
VSEENVAIVRAIFETDVTTSKEDILKALPEMIPALFHPDAEWVEAPERVDAKIFRGHEASATRLSDGLSSGTDLRGAHVS